MIPTPEHDKLAKVKDASQKCGEFLEWLKERYVLAQYHQHTRGCQASTGIACDTSTNRLYSAPTSVTKLLAEFFEIDETKLENEKRALLDEMHTSQEKR